MRAKHVTNSYASGLGHVEGFGRYDNSRGQKIGCIYLPGGGGTEISYQSGTSTNPAAVTQVVHQAADQRRRVMSIAVDWTWGNAAMVQRILDAITYAGIHLGFRTDKVHLFGVSMGTLCALNFASHHPEKVASMTLALTLADPQEIVDDNVVDPYFPSIQPVEDAYGNARPPDEYTPARHPSAFDGVPTKQWISNNDQICKTALSLALGAAAGFETVNLGNHTGILPGHDCANMDPRGPGAFMAAHDQ